MSRGLLIMALLYTPLALGQAAEERLYVRGRNDPHALSPNDVRQGDTGDCWFLAPLAAYAHARPDLLQKRIDETAPGQFRVTLRQISWLGQDVVSLVRADQLSEKGVVPRYAWYGDQVVGSEGQLVREIWVIVLEFALARYLGGHEKVDGFGFTVKLRAVLSGHSTSLPFAMRAISNVTPHQHTPAELTPHELRALLLRAEHEKRAAVVTTTDDSAHLQAHHVFAFVGFTAEGLVKLYDPNGRTLEVQLDDVLRLCRHLYVSAE